MAKTFRKQLLKYGSYVHPNNPERKMVIDKGVALSLKANFDRGVIDKVPAPWTHTDDASLNAGYVKAIEVKDDGVDMVVEFADDRAAEQAEKRLIPGVSAGLDFDYVVKQTGERVGPTLLHAALVNHPYIKGMRDFEPVVALSEDGGREVLVLSEEEEAEIMPEDEPTLTLDDIYEVLKDAHGVDVPALQARVAELEGKATLSDQIKAKLTGSKVMLSEADDVVAAVDGLISKNVQLSEKVTQLETEKTDRDAETRVQVLLSEQKIVPAQKDAYLKLAKQGVLTDEFVAAMPKVVDLSEHGHDSSHKPGGEDDATLQAEIKRHLDAIRAEQGSK